MRELIYIINNAILWFFIVLGTGYLFLMVTAFIDIMRKYKEVTQGNIKDILQPITSPPVTAIVPAYNEEENIISCIKALLNSDYKNLYINVVNDASTDQTVKILVDTFAMYPVISIIKQSIKTQRVKNYYISDKYPNLVLIDKEHGNSSDTVNVGLNACRTPLFVTVDADTLVEPDAISRIVFTMFSYSHTLAVGGAVYILNGCKVKDGVITERKISSSPIPALQTCEYLRAFMFGRSGWNTFGGTVCYPGAFTLIEHQAAMELGGYELGNSAYDFEIIIHLHEYARKHNYPHSIRFTPAAICWTDVPATLASLWRQRYMWQLGILHTAAKYKYLFYNPRYGIVGLYTYPFYVFSEIVGPLVEFTAYVMVLICWYLKILSTKATILFFILAFGFLTFLTFANTLISFITFNKYNKLRNIIWVFLLVFFETFGLRQILTICRAAATVRYLLGGKKFRRSRD